MKSVVILPGRAPHWVGDHARHLAQRLTQTGRVMVVFTCESGNKIRLPGQPGTGSVLGNSTAGYPIWTGRLSAALGLRRTSNSTVVVLWREANHLLALWAGLYARVRGERLVLDVPEVEDQQLPGMTRVLRKALRIIAHQTVQGSARRSSGNPRTVLVLSGDQVEFARLAMRTFEGMADTVASRWTLQLQVSPTAREIAYVGVRRNGKVTILTGEPDHDLLNNADVLVAAYAEPYEDLVRQAVLSGGAGVIVGQPVAGRVARCHDGTWLSQRNSAAILVALEASSGDMFERPGSVAEMRHLADEVLRVVEPEVLEWSL